ncbi:SagB/ThcOx family dehydrogenase [Corallococcus sp. AB018]|uniref:SagB/ThcOx family dehydrogenase n=4 Tax=Myxococcaceae TaxID=31 RepID=A0A7X4Y6Z4_9BACT|nr:MULTISPECIES: SagB family peptide dehydrogenase [Corallococcus]NBC40055.1 SagB/ThcOx family dehydrogenase [Corallococcus exiguus]RUO93459.1 SagB/ThcOx family dehydrogenase [Corallococcus sp. AB018]
MRLSLAEGVALRCPDAEDARVEGPGRSLRLGPLAPGVRAVFESLADGGIHETEVPAAAGSDTTLAWYWLDLAGDGGLLSWTVEERGNLLLTLTPASASFLRHRATFDAAQPLQLSRFAHTRMAEGRAVLDCPTVHATAALHDRRVVSLLFDMARPTLLARLNQFNTGIESFTLRELVRLLAETGILVPNGLDVPASEETQTALKQWEPHDLLFHLRSRGWGHQTRAGATYRFRGELPNPPALKPTVTEEVVELYRPDLEALRAGGDRSFTEVLEDRRSLRGRGASPLTVKQLGELLYRAARVREVRTTQDGEVTDRPYPGAGAAYALELYPMVGECQGLAPGAYHYDPLGHRLEKLSGPTPEFHALLDEARAPVEPFDRPEVLMVVAARVPRLAWKYETLAYSLVLQDTGALVQTLYLVSTAQGLRPYALGRSDPDFFQRVAGVDGFGEASVGAFAVSGGDSPDR